MDGVLHGMVTPVSTMFMDLPLEYRLEISLIYISLSMMRQ